MVTIQKRIVGFFVFVGLWFQLNGQQTTFFTVLDYYNDIKLNSVIALWNTGYIVTGMAKVRDSDILIARFSADGHYEWSNFVGFYDEITQSYTLDEGISLLEIPEENNFLVLATTLGGDNTLLLKYNDSGDLIWQKRYTIGFNTPAQITRTPDNAFIISGSYSVINNASARRPFLLKVDAEGNELWSKDFNYGPWTESTGRLNSLIITPEGDYLVAGLMKEKPSADAYFSVVYKLNSAGQMSWQKEFGEMTPNHNHVFLLQNGANYCLLTEAKTKTAGMQITVFNGSGNVLSADTAFFEHLYYPENVITYNDTIIFATSAVSDTSGCYLVKMNAAAKVYHNKAFVYSNGYAYNVKSIALTPDNAFVVISENYLPGETIKRPCIFKVDQNGNCNAEPNYQFVDGGIAVSVNKHEAKQSVIVKSLNNNLTEIYVPGVKAFNFSIHDVSGRAMLNGSITNNYGLVNISALKAGMYLINIRGKELNYSVKLLKK